MKQTQKNVLSLLLLTAVAGGLGLYAFYGVMKAEDDETARKEVSEKLFPVHEPGEQPPDGGEPPAPVFSALTVTARGETTELEFKEGAWRLTSPVEAPADRFAVDALLQQLKSASFKDTVDESPTDADLERYGLKPPSFTVSARASVSPAQGSGSRERSVTLHGGIENSFDGSVYLRREGETPVYSADGAVRFALAKNTFELRDKEVLGLEEAGLVRVEVKAKQNAWGLERAGDQGWRMAQPVAQSTDPERVKQMLWALRTQRAVSFPPDTAENRQKLGLLKPTVEARFTLDSGEQVLIRLSRVEESGTVKAYALREQGTTAVLAEVPEVTLGTLDVPVQELKDRRVLAFRREAVQQVVFQPGGQSAPLVIARSSHGAPGTTESWEMVSPETGKAKTFKMLSLLRLIETLKATDFGEARPRSWETYGINDASPGVKLLGAAGQVLAHLQLGDEVPGKENRQWARGSREEVLEVDSVPFGEMPEEPKDLLEALPATPDAGTADSPP